MKFSLVVLTSFLGVTIADTHKFCWCAVNYSLGAGGGWRLYTDSTAQACQRYRARNTGSKWYDKCPDCTTTDGARYGSITIAGCHSPGAHLGGDEWDYYCGQVADQKGYCKEGYRKEMGL
ncbi:hypothetical protein EDB81DRAFT_892302 [Dactylonectria macrodidyma]|uniref:Cyanovirin-N domain-containing protein n=1 Tax=Dactylonectria macrodidyma TaxID=307937 RepID=A0A9P9DE08_9HYPO|nr:hypothetical protein EDB81DRAFT_892302 [Dactylonectria macrodidyma]